MDYVCFDDIKTVGLVLRLNIDYFVPEDRVEPLHFKPFDKQVHLLKNSHPNPGKTRNNSYPNNDRNIPFTPIFPNVP